MTPTARKIAERCADAYSFDRYASWPAVAQTILSLGYSEDDTEEIMRSKLTRWAADEYGARYGRVPAKAVRIYLEKHPNHTKLIRVYL